MARKSNKRFNDRSRFPHKKRLLATIAVVVVLAFGNWFAHQPTASRASFGVMEPTLESLGIITADITDALGLTGHDVSVPYTSTPTRGPLPFGEPKVIDPKKTPDDLVVLKRKGYWVAWSPSLRHPVWTAYSVPTTKLLEFPPERPPFERDPQAPTSSSPTDYTGSGYDRGHMAPNYLIATRFGKAAQRETFLMSNIAPQKPTLNRGPWRLLEQTVADDLSGIGDTLWVITGTVPERQRRVGKSSVFVPKGFYKIIAAIHQGRLRVLAIFMPQEIRESKRPRYCFCSIDDLEEMTGLDFFPTLSKERQTALEAPEANRFWPTWSLFQ